jgi:hypothetical protein
MKKRLGLPTPYISLLLIGLFILTPSCIPEQSARGKKSSGGATSNASNSVNPNYGRYLTDNPIALSGNTSFSVSTDLSTVLGSEQRFITSNQFLIGSCVVGGQTISSCYETRASETSSYLTADENRWAFGTSGDGFLQVQAFGNTRDIVDKWHTQLKWSYDYALAYGHESSIPTTLFSGVNRAYWYKSGLLKTYANCGLENNAYYDPGSQSICLGHIAVNPSLYFATDPTVTWHEMGHAFNQISMNMRHQADGRSIAQASTLGSLFYDEAGALNEGIADWYSFFMNGRTHMGEWSLGRYLSPGASRPMAENDSLHAAGISETNAGRLSYPTYINYDPNNYANKEEDVHYGGQIASHFLTGFYKSLQDSSVCGVDSTQALRLTVHLLSETLGELGDQTATATGTTSLTQYHVNLDPTNAHDWISKVRLTNYRKFFQVFSKYFLRTIGNSLYNICPTGHYPQDNYEKLLDSYGLLLFRTYNDNDNGITTGHGGSNTAVTLTNRIKTTLINKEHLMFSPSASAASAYIIDDQADIRAAMENMILTGQIAGVSTKIDGNFGYNNGNGQISPGEVVGVSLNLYNNSNATMAGLHILANDWDHTKGSKPCNNFGDSWPLDSEGAADLTAGEGAQGGCDYVTRYNGQDSVLESDEEINPVCFIEMAEDSSTQWRTQNALISQMGMSPNECLGGSTSQKDCFIRAIKGADHSFFSKLNAKKTWVETIYQDSAIEPTFNSNNVIFFEVSPETPPGTTFNCRMRARFTNCDDCYHDGDNSEDDYLDYEFSGAKPFQLINFKFTVID